VDAIEQAAAKHGENGSVAVCVGSSAVPDSRRPVWTSFHQSIQSVILVTTLIQTYRCGCTLHALCPAVLQFCDRSVTSVSRSVGQSFGHAVTYRVAGLPARLLDRLQLGLNAAARLVYGLWKYDHVTPLLKDLHWLCVLERIAFRLAVLVYRCQHKIAPPYLANELHRLAEVQS